MSGSLDRGGTGGGLVGSLGFSGDTRAVCDWGVGVFFLMDETCADLWFGESSRERKMRRDTRRMNDVFVGRNRCGRFGDVT